MRALLFPLFLCACTWLPVHAQTGLHGTFLALVDGMTCRLAVQTARNAIQGTYDEGGTRLKIVGTLYGRQANGELQDSFMHTTVATFKIVLINNNSINLTFSKDGQQRSEIFVREGWIDTEAKIQAEYHTRDTRLVGNWSYDIIVGSSGSSLQTTWYLQVSANGRYAQYTKSVGSGADWLYNPGQMELQQQGLWYTEGNIFYIKTKDQLGYTAAATYRFQEGSLITEDVSGQKIWAKF